MMKYREGTGIQDEDLSADINVDIHCFEDKLKIYWCIWRNRHAKAAIRICLLH